MGQNKYSACSVAPLMEEEPLALAAAAGMSRAPNLHRNALLLPEGRDLFTELKGFPSPSSNSAL